MAAIARYAKSKIKFNLVEHYAYQCPLYWWETIWNYCKDFVNGYYVISFLSYFCIVWKNKSCKVSVWAIVWIKEPLATLPVFFLNAKPSMQIFLSVTVLNSDWTIRLANRVRWKLLKETTWFQYSATSGRFKHSLKTIHIKRGCKLEIH